MQLHLDAISQAVPSGKHAVLVIDRAPWHTSKKLSIPSNISLLFLPSYSPELNSAEQLWDYMRQHTLANRSFKNYDDILDACCEAWIFLTSQQNRIQSMCSRSWAFC
jgi:transposase